MSQAYDFEPHLARGYLQKWIDTMPVIPTRLCVAVMRRWPLHPAPARGEALTSWLHRLARVYRISAEQLVRQDLTPQWDPKLDALSSLDFRASEELLTALAERSGRTVEELQRMTMESWVPGFFDPRQIEPTPGAAFDAYVSQYSVLFPTDQRQQRRIIGWLAWLPASRKLAAVGRACPTCVGDSAEGAFGLTLIAQLPLTLSCPEHGCRLERAYAHYLFQTWETDDTRARAATEQTIIQDNRTEEALRTGSVVLRHRTIEMAAWFRLLRVLIEELSIPLSQLRAKNRNTIELIWGAAGHPARAGISGPVKTYEMLTWRHQEMYLEAAATAVQLIETGRITASGSLGHLLTRETSHSMPGEPATPKVRNRWADVGKLWEESRGAIDDAVALAQQDPGAARSLLSQVTLLTRREDSFEICRTTLVGLGIPSSFLPRTLAEQRAPSVPKIVVPKEETIR